jgi:urease gamma subunit
VSWASYRESGGVLLSHGECHTIIGAKAFHGPVRDGKAWDHLAMATRHKLSTNSKKLCIPDLRLKH